MMIALLIFLFLFLLSMTYYIFYNAFTRGKVFDITKQKLKKESKLNKYLTEFHSNLDYINKIPFNWHYMISDDGLKLAAKFFECPHSNKIMILFHGYRSIAENDFSAYFKWYYEQGFHILLVDQRAHGKSEGKYITFGIKEKNDCVKWCKYVTDHFDYIHHIYLCGMSMGATTILLASGLNLPEKVKGLIADSGFTSPKDMLMKVASSDYGLDVSVLFPLLNFICRHKAKFNLDESNVKEAMKNNHLPILFIHALSDDFVPSKMTKQNYEECHTLKELVLVDCVTHGFACVYEKGKVQSALQNFLKHCED